MSGSEDSMDANGLQLRAGGLASRSRGPQPRRGAGLSHQVSPFGSIRSECRATWSLGRAHPDADVAGAKCGV